MNAGPRSRSQRMTTVTTRPFDPSRSDDLDRLFASDPVVDRCWCMWFITRVADFHEGGRSGNRSAFFQLAEREPDPLGLIAYSGTGPVGWCAIGPRRRFARILRAPTLKERDRSEDDTVWFVPCFFIRPDTRRQGVAAALLSGAVELARSQGAPAIEGFPLAGGKARSGGSDFMTGVEPLFASMGFIPTRRPSNNRVIMRLNLA